MACQDKVLKNRTFHSFTIDNFGTNNNELNDGTILFGDLPDSMSISAAKIVSELNGTDVLLWAGNNIDVTVPIDASGNVNSHGLTLQSPVINIGPNANINLPNAVLTLTNDVVLGGNVSLNTGAAGNIFFGGTISSLGAQNLILTAGTGNVTLSSPVAGTVNLTVNTIGFGSLPTISAKQERIERLFRSIFYDDKIGRLLISAAQGKLWNHPPSIELEIEGDVGEWW